MLGYELALDARMNYSVSPPKANYFGDLWIFNDLECSLDTNVDSLFDCHHNEEWSGVCSTDQIAGVKCHQSKLFFEVINIYCVLYSLFSSILCLVTCNNLSNLHIFLH